jgi:hypothetical protein
MNPSPMNPWPPVEPPRVTRFLKPAFGITVRSHGLTVAVRAYPEGKTPGGQRARG